MFHTGRLIGVIRNVKKSPLCIKRPPCRFSASSAFFCPTKPDRFHVLKSFILLEAPALLLSAIRTSTPVQRKLNSLFVDFATDGKKRSSYTLQLLEYGFQATDRSL